MARGTEEARRLAADPTTDWATLYELAQTNPEVHADLAANPATYPDLLAWLAALGKPEVDAVLAHRATPTSPDTASPEPGAGPDQTAVSSPPAARETQVITTPAAQPETPPAYAPAAAAAAAGVPLTVERISVSQTFGRSQADSSPASPAQPPPTQPPLLPQQPAESTGSRRPLMAVLAVVGVLVIAGIAWLLGRGDEPAGTATTPSTVTTAPTTPATPAPTTAAPTPETDDRAGLDVALAALAGTLDSTSCSDPDGDSAAFVGYANARLAVEPWGDDARQTLGEAIGILQSRCNAGYAVQVADRAGAQVPDIAAQLAGRDWVVPTLPGPADAADITSFSSPTGNIACTLEEESVRCSIAQYSFGSPDTCPDPGAPVTAVIDASGARPDCAVGPVIGGPSLPYGTAARHSHFACTSEQDGVTCWDTWTGARLKLARATLELQGPVFGSIG